MTNLKSKFQIRTNGIRWEVKWKRTWKGPGKPFEYWELIAVCESEEEAKEKLKKVLDTEAKRYDWKTIDLTDFEKAGKEKNADSLDTNREAIKLRQKEAEEQSE